VKTQAGSNEAQWMMFGLTIGLVGALGSFTWVATYFLNKYRPDANSEAKDSKSCNIFSSLASMISMFDQNGGIRPLRVFLVVKHELLSVTYNEHSRSFRCCDGPNVQPMPKSRTVRLGSFIFSSCISIALAIVFSELHGGDETSSTNLRCVDRFNPGNIMTVQTSSSSSSLPAISKESTWAAILVGIVDTYVKGPMIGYASDIILPLKKRGWLLGIAAGIIMSIVFATIGIGWIILAFEMASRSTTEVRMYVYVYFFSQISAWLVTSPVTNTGLWVVGKIVFIPLGLLFESLKAPTQADAAVTGTIKVVVSDDLDQLGHSQGPQVEACLASPPSQVLGTTSQESIKDERNLKSLRTNDVNHSNVKGQFHESDVDL
jgi:hypothetical protein